jgi:hypothetical protein
MNWLSLLPLPKTTCVQYRRCFWQLKRLLRSISADTKINSTKRTIHLEARGEEDGLGAEALCRAAGHGRMHPELARLVGGGGHHAALVRRSAHNDGLAAILGVVPLLDTGVEGIQVEMQDRSFFFVHHLHNLWAVFITRRFHCTSIRQSFFIVKQSFCNFGVLAALQRKYFQLLSPEMEKLEQQKMLFYLSERDDCH